jgi:acetylornithine deacetylase/succinyl-diaminopimelate desuccinylase-like protein
MMTSLAFALALVFAQSLELETVSRLQEYLRIDTINPPGNESRAVEFFARLLEAEGIPYETAEATPGRGNLWARLEGGVEPALILLNHTDVVPADPRHWTTSPLSGELRDGQIWGRGALDMKGTGILQFQAFVALHRAGKPLRRDVVFVATADEEAGGFQGAGWLVKNRPEIFADAKLLLTEGGWGSLDSGVVSFDLEVTQKVPLWLRLTASDEPGHGSTPRVSSSVSRLIRALANIDDYDFPPSIVPAVEIYFEGLAESQQGEWKDRFANIAEAVKDPRFLLALQLENPMLHALTRNTCSITKLEGSSKINVVPPEVSAEIDCRLLPDQDPTEFVNELRSIANDPGIRIETLMAFTPAVSSTDSDLYRAIETVVERHYPGTRVIPSVSTHFADSHFFRDLGIISYGFDPTVVPAEIQGTMHGNDERVPAASIEKGVRHLLEILEILAY